MDVQMIATGILQLLRVRSLMKYPIVLLTAVLLGTTAAAVAEDSVAKELEFDEIIFVKRIPPTITTRT
jgi:hypothetical protein